MKDRRSDSKFTQGHSWGLILLLGACPDDGGSTEAETVTSTSTSSESIGFIMPTGPTTGSDPVVPCNAEYPLPPVMFVTEKPLTGGTVTPAIHCPDLPTEDFQLLSGEPFPVLIYSPVAWSQGVQWPLVLFSPGVNQNITDDTTELYGDIFNRLAESGFVVVALQPDDANWSVSERFSAMLCTLLWLDSTQPGGWSEAGQNRLNCDVIAMGHSRGGEAAFRLIDRFPHLADVPGLPAWKLRSVVGISPLSLGAADNEVPADASFPIAPELSVPYLALNGANDNDVLGGSSARAYDILAPETMAPFSIWDKVSMWAYGVPHCAWGGQALGDGPGQCDITIQERARGSAVASSYISAFLEWQVLQENVLQNRQYFSRPVEVDAAAVAEDFPIEVLDNSLWSGFEPQFGELSGRPVIVEDLEIGTCGDPDARLRLDTMDRAGGPFPCDSQMLSPSTLGMSVSLVGLATDQVCLSPAEEFSGHGKCHVTDVMRIQWGGTKPAGEVHWEVDASLTSFSYVALRVGQGYGAALPDDKSEVDLVILSEDSEGASISAFVTLTPILQQDDSSGANVTEIMRTFRIPLRLFVDQGAVLDNVTELVVRLPNDASEREVLLDSIVFEKDYEQLPTMCN